MLFTGTLFGSTSPAIKGKSTRLQIQPNTCALARDKNRRFVNENFATVSNALCLVPGKRVSLHLASDFGALPPTDCVALAGLGQLTFIVPK